MKHISKKTIILLYLFIVLFVSNTRAQESITQSRNLPRVNDKLIIQQVDYQSPGNKGCENIWDFSQLKMINEKYKLFYHKGDSTQIIGTQHATNYTYQLINHKLVIDSYENATTSMYYVTSELELAYPLSYNAQLSSYFQAHGCYSNHYDLSIYGLKTIEADALGDLVLPSLDTLKHVLRVHSVRRLYQKMEIPNPFNSKDSLVVLNSQSIDSLLLKEKNQMEIHSWRFYVDGYRYPVFESIKSYIIKEGVKKDHISTSFCYSPVEQEYELQPDESNEDRRDELGEELWEKEHADPSNPNNQPSVPTSPEDKVTRHETHLEGGSKIILNYELNTDAKVSISLTDYQGRKLSNTSTISQQSGTYQEEISLIGQPRGEYLLYLIIDGHPIGEKIIKPTN